MLRELQLTNFKCWEAIERMRLAPITGLFGTNSSGKSSVMQLLLMLKQTVESADRAAVFELAERLVSLGSFHDMVFGQDATRRLSFSVDWRRPKQLALKDPTSNVLFSGSDLAFSCSVSEKKSGRLAVDTLSYELDGKSFSMQRLDQSPEGKSEYDVSSKAVGFEFRKNVGRPYPLPHPVKCYGFPDQTYAKYQNAGFLAELQLAFEELFGSVYYLGPLRDFPQRHYPWKGSEPADMGRRGDRVVDALLASRQRGRYISPGYKRKHRSLEEQVAIWLKELNLIEEFSVRPIAQERDLYEVRVRATSGSAEALLPDVGFGLSQVLPVIVLCYYVPEGSTVLLEQPEIHLHPSAQSGLADVFVDVMRNRGVQIIVESHSEHLLRRLQRRVAEEGLRPEETALYFSSMEGESAHLTELEVDMFGNIVNWPEGFFGDQFAEIAGMTQAAMARKKQG